MTVLSPKIRPFQFWKLADLVVDERKRNEIKCICVQCKARNKMLEVATKVRQLSCRCCLRYKAEKNTGKPCGIQIASCTIRFVSLHRPAFRSKIVKAVGIICCFCSFVCLFVFITISVRHMKNDRKPRTILAQSTKVDNIMPHLPSTCNIAFLVSLTHQYQFFQACWSQQT